MRRHREPTERQYDSWAAELSAWVAESVSPFERESLQAKEERIRRSESDILLFCKTYLPHYFTSDFAEFHEEWKNIASGKYYKKKGYLICIPRGFGKSTFWSLAVPLWSTVYKKRNFILYLGNTINISSRNSLSVRIELEENRRIINDFPLSGKGRVWSDELFVTKGGVAHSPVSIGTSMRGIKYMQNRPDLIVGDDVETDETAISTDASEKIVNFVLKAVMPSISKDGVFIMIGNKISDSCAMQILEEHESDDGHKSFLSIQYPAWLNRNTSEEKPLWEAEWPASRLIEMERAIGTVAFNAEFQHLTLDKDSEFNIKTVTYYTELPDCLKIVSCCDPAGTDKSGSDYRSIVTVGLDRKNMMFYVLDAWIRKESIEKMLFHNYLVHERYNCKFCGIEDNMFKDFLLYAISSYANKVGYFLPWKTYTSVSNKRARIIGTLSILWSQKRLLFKRGHSDQGLLITQLCSLNKKSTKDDGPDALEGAVSLLQRCGLGSIEYRRVERRRVNSTGPAGRKRSTF